MVTNTLTSCHVSRCVQLTAAVHLFAGLCVCTHTCSTFYVLRSTFYVLRSTFYVLRSTFYKLPIFFKCLNVCKEVTYVPSYAVVLYIYGT
jgi:hypothetical protein